jgi:hypothetical protein
MQSTLREQRSGTLEERYIKLIKYIMLQYKTLSHTKDGNIYSYEYYEDKDHIVLLINTSKPIPDDRQYFEIQKNIGNDNFMQLKVDSMLLWTDKIENVVVIGKHRFNLQESVFDTHKSVSVKNEKNDNNIVVRLR